MRTSTGVHLSLRANPQEIGLLQAIDFRGDKVELCYGEDPAIRMNVLADFVLTDDTLTLSNIKDILPSYSSDDDAPAASTTAGATTQPNVEIYHFRHEHGHYEWDDAYDETIKHSATERYVFDKDPCGYDMTEAIYYVFPTENNENDDSQ
ncbi:hypothetical protein BC940DRAFT_288719 [Gongronella butleri]|nr:hypothetical protein BC940DRAFT_288719 [Gongronella butleri]